jgi:hypothetical protein
MMTNPEDESGNGGSHEERVEVVTDSSDSEGPVGESAKQRRARRKQKEKEELTKFVSEITLKCLEEFENKKKEKKSEKKVESSGTKHPPQPSPRNKDKSSSSSLPEYNTVSFNYDCLNQFASANHVHTGEAGKPPHFDGSDYSDWATKMRWHLMMLGVWEVVNVDLQVPQEDEEYNDCHAVTCKRISPPQASLATTCARKSM